MIPDGGSTTELNAASGVALPVGGYGRLPAGFAIGQTGFQRWQARDAGDRDRVSRAIKQGFGGALEHQWLKCQDDRSEGRAYGDHKHFRQELFKSSYPLFVLIGQSQAQSSRLTREIRQAVAVVAPSVSEAISKNDANSTPNAIHPHHRSIGACPQQRALESTAFVPPRQGFREAFLSSEGCAWGP